MNDTQVKIVVITVEPNEFDAEKMYPYKKLMDQLLNGQHALLSREIIVEITNGNVSIDTRIGNVSNNPESPEFLEKLLEMSSLPYMIDPDYWVSLSNLTKWPDSSNEYILSISGLEGYNRQIVRKCIAKILIEGS